MTRGSSDLPENVTMVVVERDSGARRGEYLGEIPYARLGWVALACDLAAEANAASPVPLVVEVRYCGALLFVSGARW